MFKIELSFLFLLSTLPLLTGCNPGSNPETDAEVSDIPAVPVQVAKAEVVTLHPELELVGTLIAVPEQTAVVSPQLGGWVEHVNVVEGEHVKAGQLLAQLDAHAAQTDIERAQGVVAEKTAILHRLKRGYLPREIEGARKDRDKAQATLDGLQNELTALKDLLDRHEISPVTYETKAKAVHAAEAALASAQARVSLLEEGTPVEQIEEAQGLLEVAQADLEHAQLVLKWCSITSPINGIVTKLTARQGQFFDRAIPMVTITDLSSVFVQLRVPSRHFAQVQCGSPVQVRLDSFPGRTFEGTIERVSGEADPLTGNVVVFAKLPNKDNVLRPGLGCVAQVALPEVPDALVIPLAAVGDNSGTPVVTVVRNGTASETVVELGAETSQFVQVTQGLSAGDEVATAGGYGLPEGCQVRIVDNLAAANAGK
ncbi:efflux RND transporter periplasmic adaptor subunit [Blastopirellula marina]|uniref:efflux RND transporter periplasmic adaptor subunit n=1 Tax=Blastopirellula marina TaxID=124 RepID=UPI001304F69E|nr:efflux RND transporter periplasmic adaptor subunit [Blastopirellula marina]